MKKIYIALFSILLCMIANVSFATTYYVRSSGGTAVQCTGTTNADYSGSGTAQACAFSHPAWALGTGNSIANGKMVGGDTLIIDDTSSASYMVGYGMPNTSGCSLFAPYDWPCTLKKIPSGPNAATPTKILGSSYASGCATKPQIWGTQMVGDSNKGIFNASGSNNIEIQCLEITDHSNCGFRTGTHQCSENQASGTASGTYARGPAIFANGGSNFTLKNLDIHGLSGNGIQIVAVNGMIMSHVNLDGNHQAGWNGAYTNTSADAMAGNIVIDHTKTRFSGCSEAYPRSGSFTAADYSDCTGDPASGAYSDGWGFANTSGNWIITDSEWSHNMSDGLDLLYGQNGMNVSIDRSLFEGNNGNQLKLTAKNINITNTAIIGTCTYLSLAGKVTGGDICRAGGVPLAITPVLGSVVKLTNNTIYAATDADASAVFEISNRNGSCNGTETYTLKNNIFVSPNGSSGQWTPFYSSLTGSCATAFSGLTIDHSKIYNFQSNPSGTGNSFTAPSWVGSISTSSYSNLSNVYLSSNVGGGTSTTFWNTSNDINNFPQNGTIDQGAIQYGSSLQLAAAGQACTATTDCSAGTCSSFSCTGGCTNNASSCSTNSQCCSGYCSTTCQVPPTCGDAVLQTGETCDTTNLNGQNCITQGYTGGTLSCASDCKSFVTSSCNNTLVFPLTPLLDNFNRSNEGPPPSSSWAVYGSTAGKVVSNAYVGSTFNAADNQQYWSPSSFGPDVEVYATVSTVRSADTWLLLNARMDIAANNGYTIEWTADVSRIRVRRIDAGVKTTLGADITQAMASGDSLGMSIVGNTISVYYKASGGSWTLLTTRTDSTYTGAGRIMFGSWSSASGAIYDNVGGGTLNPITCGNSLKETGEACDSTDLAGQSCVTQGFASGTLSCNSDCNSFNTSSCSTASNCGNNTKETGEICDGTDLDSQTCTGLGYSSGSLSCNSDCLSYVTTGCVSTNSSVSGGIVFK